MFYHFYFHYIFEILCVFYMESSMYQLLTSHSATMLDSTVLNHLPWSWTADDERKNKKLS